MLIDNKKSRNQDVAPDIKTVWDFIYKCSGLGTATPKEGALDIVTGYFTIRALSKLYREIPENDEFRLVSSELVKEDGDDSHILDLLNGNLDVETAVSLDQYAEDAKAFLRRNSVHVRAILDAFCHAKAYIFSNRNSFDGCFYLSGSSNLTEAGLGLKPTSNVELNTGITCDKTYNDYKEICSWFEDVWKAAKEEILIDPANPKAGKISVKEYFIRRIEECFRKYTPEEIYYKILFEMFNADIELDDSIEHRKDMSLLQTSVIWNTLFNYQQKGVISLIKMLRKYNGAILADAVGLGKTFSALAVIKYFQTQGYTTLVLCPKKLEQNWTQYQRRHDSQFEKDDLDYLVRFHTDLQDDRLQKSYDEADLAYIQRRNKLLIVIDESHNLRNENSGRYKELVDSIIKKKGEEDKRDIKILMLSATPINTGLKDVKGQFNLIARGDDKHFDDEDFDIESLTFLFADCQKKYNAWCKDENRTIGGFIAELPSKFFNLTDRLIVARTRKMIEKTLGEDLHFPKKAKPENIYQGVDHFGKYRSTDEIYDAFDKLNLTAYQPSQYLQAPSGGEDRKRSSNWQDDVYREEFLVKMMGILFMKRLESSWYSCMHTVKKVLDVHETTLAMVVDLKTKRLNGEVSTIIGDDFDDEELEEMFTMYRKKDTVRLSDMKNLDGFEAGLRKDIENLREIYANLQAYEKDYELGIEKDLKLDELERILRAKKQSGNPKAVIFTVYADTARFIYDELLKRGFRRMAMVSGQECISTGCHDTRNFNEILQSFAPFSKLYKEKDWSGLFDEQKLSRAQYYDETKRKWNVPYDLWYDLMRRTGQRELRLIDDGIDILIATDCLSEGQNLQDADMQINYDIHWNPVRLIQRFGRIDRIGSPCPEIKSVNFWPAKSFEDYLNLENRIMNRMAIMNLTGAETQEVNDRYKQMVADNTLQDKNADRLLRELSENSISDIESDQTLSLKDFSLESYRQDLLEYFEKHKDFFRKMPCGVYSGFKIDPDLFSDMPESIIAVLGYPHREEGSSKQYKSIYLVCQPVDAGRPAVVKEYNQAEILEFLRKNKKMDRFVPDWIEAPNAEKIAKLSEILRRWTQSQFKEEGQNLLDDLFSTQKTVAEKPSLTTKLSQKFKLENFDLIVWDYLSK
jgi:superfamily II DNA or RNA helicase